MENEHEIKALTSRLNQGIDQAFEAVALGPQIIIRSRKANSRVFLVLSLEKEESVGYFLCILRHRSSELTESYKGKPVRQEWVVGFCREHSQEALGIEEIKYDSIPSDCEILKKTEDKVVVKDKFGSVVTAYKDGVPQLSPEKYDGTRTRTWERSALGVTNWHYDSVRY